MNCPINRDLTFDATILEPFPWCLKTIWLDFCLDASAPNKWSMKLTIGKHRWTWLFQAFKDLLPPPPPPSPGEMNLQGDLECPLQFRWIFSFSSCLFHLDYSDEKPEPHLSLCPLWIPQLCHRCLGGLPQLSPTCSLSLWGWAAPGRFPNVIFSHVFTLDWRPRADLQSLSGAFLSFSDSLRSSNINEPVMDLHTHTNTLILTHISRSATNTLHKYDENWLSVLWQQKYY